MTTNTSSRHQRRSCITKFTRLNSPLTASSLLSTCLLWIHQLILGLLGGFIPSIIASAIIIRYVNLDNYATSPFRKYIGKCMTRNMEAVRLVGQFVVWFGCAYPSLFFCTFQIEITNYF